MPDFREDDTMTGAVASSPLPGCEAVWQKTMTLTDFDPAALEHERTRNARPAYGLTLVADYPLPDDLLANIERLRQPCRLMLGDGVELYPDDHLHLTVYSLMRSRTNPLSREELAAVWSSWLPRLKDIASELTSLVVPLQGLAVTWNGAVMICGAATDSLRRLQRPVSRLPDVAASRDVPPHVTIGQVKRPCGTTEAFGKAMTALRRHAADSIGSLHSARLHVLYYRSRLLDQVIQSEAIDLGRSLSSL
jgi:2'-5' RNA ligase